MNAVVFTVLLGLPAGLQADSHHNEK